VAGITGAMIVSRVAGFIGALGGLRSGVGAQGGVLGGAFGKAFVAAAVAAGIYSFLKNTKTERPLEEAETMIFGGHTKFEKDQKKREAAERKKFLTSPTHQAEEHRAAAIRHRDPALQIRNPQLRHSVEQYERQQRAAAHKTEHHVHSHVKVDVSGHELGRVVAHQVLHDQRAAREIGEAVTKYAHVRTARE
jgi:hypothetical protein